MSSPAFRSAQQAAKTLANYFLLENWTAPARINIAEIRELRDSLTVVHFYLKRKREEIGDRLLKNESEYRREICDEHMGVDIPGDGGGQDYHVPPIEGDGELVEVVVSRPSCSSPSCMLLGE